MADSVSMPVFALLFALSLGAAFGDSIVSMSIDCGADDDSFIDTGVKRSILPEYERADDPLKILKTLRSFPEGRRNCYTLRPPNAKTNQKYHLIAYFLYGNYDNQTHNPTFDLHVGVNIWATVRVQKPATNNIFEIIYVSDTEYVDVCLVKTGPGVPFISRLELNGFDDSMYQVEPGSSLIRNAGAVYDVGAPRYYFDSNGRFWNILDAIKFSPWVPFNTTEKIVSSGKNNPNSVPDTMWSNAARSRNASTPLSFRQQYSDTSIHQLHIYFYFAEIENVPQREMTISLNGGSKVTVTLDRLTPVTIGPLKINVTTEFYFSIESVDEDLPAIVNGFEILKLDELVNHPTDSGDVAAMMEIKKIFQVTKNWQGDPCGPPDGFAWKGVECSNDNPPRIISLELRSSNLTGELPAALSNLTAIKSLDLSHNELNGSLPAFLAQLQSLTDLVLSENNLTAPVPSELTQKFKDAPDKLRLDGNPLCTSYACDKTTKTSNFTLPLVLAVVTFSILVIVLSLVIFLRRRRQARGSLEPKDRVLSYSKVASITSNFKTVIGEGGFGMVYHGVLDDQTQVAVKVLSKSSTQGCKEFRAEAQLLMIVHHRNLVSLVGYCNENGHMGLIYEYMANGNLQQHLSETKDNILSWRDRLQIAVSSAQGLEYLHNGCKPPIVHRDLKPANILLDEKMQAKISDFGLSRAFSSESMSIMETNVAGTLGYLDPEYQSSGNLNKKSDVYSFGIILLEIITGQRAIIRGPESCTHIVQWVNPKIRRGDIQAIVDPRLGGEFNSNAAWKAVEVAMSCVEPTGIQRPDMNDVLVELKEALEMEMRHQRGLSVGSMRMRSTSYSMEMEPLENGEDMTPQAGDQTWTCCIFRKFSINTIVVHVARNINASSRRLIIIFVK